MSVPVISISPSANRPSIVEVLLLLLPLGSCDVNELHVVPLYPSKPPEPVYLIEPSVLATELPIIMAPEECIESRGVVTPNPT